MQSAGFLQFSLWFSVFVKNDGSFLILLSDAFSGFSGFAKEITLCIPAYKTQFRRRASVDVVLLLNYAI